MDEIVIYKSEDGNIKVDVRFEGDTVWLTQAQMAELLATSTQNITIHLANVYQEGELSREATCKEFLQVRTEGSREVKRSLTYYNLDVIISVGYRVKSRQGTQFRIWATQRLREYIIKGFSLNDERFKSGSSMNYFKELLERIREIRMSEKVFYQQIKDIYATSVDYDPASDLTLGFFKQIQNTLLWAVSGKTAAELLWCRANADLPQMGLTSTRVPSKVRKTDVEVAKNYLNKEEISTLKLLVEQYLAYAEAQALAHKVMYQKDWIEKLRMILQLNDKNILTHAGKISHEMAAQKVQVEYDKYKNVQKQTEHLQSIKELNADLEQLTLSQKQKSKKS